MVAPPRYTTADVELLPDRLDDTRYEIVDGELYVAKQPSWHHQQTCGRVFSHLDTWSVQTGAGDTGTDNEKRDREAKLYSRRGVLEHWILSWQLRQVEIYRREGAALRLVATLREGDTLRSRLLPGFSCTVAEFFR